MEKSNALLLTGLAVEEVKSVLRRNQNIDFWREKGGTLLTHAAPLGSPGEEGDTVREDLVSLRSHLGSNGSEVNLII